MSHQSGGFFYYSFKYACPYTTTGGTSAIDETYVTALYSPTPRQDHALQTAWFTNKFRPAAQADVEKNFYGDADRNTLGRTYARYQLNYVKEIDFSWKSKLPVHTDGPLKGKVYGKQI